MLTIEDLAVKYPGTTHRVVERVDLEIATGETLGLVGESGYGKSTVARAIVGLVAAEAGRIEIDGVDTTEGSGPGGAHRRRTVQMVFQDPAASLHPRLTVGVALTEAASVVPGRSHKEATARIGELLDLVGIPQGWSDRYPFELSGGQRQRVAVARALAAEPRLILLDEVTASLDVSIQATVLNLLRELQRELGLTYLAISHDLAVMRYLCDRIAVMEAGTICEVGDADAVLGAPLHHYTDALIDAVPVLGRARDRRIILTGEPTDPADRPSGCSFHLRCPAGPEARADRERCRTEVPTRTGDPHDVRCHYPLH